MDNNFDYSIFEYIHDICSEQDNCSECPFAMYRPEELHKYKCLLMTTIPCCWSEKDIAFCDRRLDDYTKHAVKKDFAEFEGRCNHDLNENR